MGVIKDPVQFKNFENYPSLPQTLEKNISDLETLASALGARVVKYRQFMQEVLDVAQRVVNRDTSLDVFVPAGGPNTPTLFLRTEGSGNPFDGRKTRTPEYRATAGGNDFYAERQ